ncbi:hypothetical protein JW933_10410 [candidate division FCPU426 bacterium]|nr:hypothetical protein [candidate division FCPU426 bacterium]
MVEGKYAYQALQLLADLADAGRLRKAAAREEILELAALISDARNVYVFDGRLKMLSALERIMTFIISRGFVAPEDLSALLVVDDTYRYVSEDSRAFGLQTGFRLGTELDIDNDEASTYNQDNVLQSYSKEEVSTFTTYAGLEIHYACPLDRHWQLTTSAYADYKYKRFNYGEDIPKRHFAIGAVEGKLDYYFNTRWRLGMGINGNITGDLVPFVISTRESYYRQYKESYRQIITAAGLSANMSYQLNTDLEWTASLSGRWEKSQCFDYSLEAEYPQPSVGIPPSVINQMHHDFMDELGFSWSIGTWLSYRIF